MPNPQFDDLARLLLSRGIPAPDVARYVGEIHDHREDLAAEFPAQGTDSETAEKRALDRLGSSQCLAQAAVSAHQRRFIAARNPWLFFAILPALMTPVLTTLVLLIPLLCVELSVRKPLHVAGILALILTGVSAFMNYFWPGLMALRYLSCGLAPRARLDLASGRCRDRPRLGNLAPLLDPAGRFHSRRTILFGPAILQLADNRGIAHRHRLHLVATAPHEE